MKSLEFEKLSSVGVVGLGKMGQALVRGLLCGQANFKLSVYDRNESKRALFANDDVSICSSLDEVLSSSELLLFAVKSKEISELAECGKSSEQGFGPLRVVCSTAADMPLAQLDRAFAGEYSAARIMPNLAAAVCSSYTAVYCEDVETQTLFEKFSALFGETVSFSEEEKLSAVTALSASGLAFVALLTEAFADAGVAIGLDKAGSLEASLATMQGAVDLMISKNPNALSPSDLRKFVASPKGTTIEGLAVLEAAGVRSDIIEAVRAAFSKALT